jgi:hypothetical protein
MATDPEPDFLSFSQRQDTRTTAIQPRDRLTTAVSRLKGKMPMFVAKGNTGYGNG